MLKELAAADYLRSSRGGKPTTRHLDLPRSCLLTFSMALSAYRLRNMGNGGELQIVVAPDFKRVGPPKMVGVQLVGLTWAYCPDFVPISARTKVVVLASCVLFLYAWFSTGHASQGLRGKPPSSMALHPSPLLVEAMGCFLLWEGGSLHQMYILYIMWRLLSRMVQQEPRDRVGQAWCLLVFLCAGVVSRPFPA